MSRSELLKGVGAFWIRIVSEKFFRRVFEYEASWFRSFKKIDEPSITVEDLGDGKLSVLWTDIHADIN